MKKIIALVGLLLLTISCNVESDPPKYHYELLPVASYELPTDFYVDTENEIVINYSNPSNCHVFDGFYYEKAGQTRTIAVQTSVIEQNNCTTLTNQIVAKTLTFNPTETGTYVFKFWKGKDLNGVDVFEEVAIDVQ